MNTFEGLINGKLKVKIKINEGYYVYTNEKEWKINYIKIKIVILSLLTFKNAYYHSTSFFSENFLTKSIYLESAWNHEFNDNIFDGFWKKNFF